MQRIEDYYTEQGSAAAIPIISAGMNSARSDDAKPVLRPEQPRARPARRRACSTRSRASRSTSRAFADAGRRCCGSAKASTIRWPKRSVRRAATKSSHATREAVNAAAQRQRQHLRARSARPHRHDHRLCGKHESRCARPHGNRSEPDRWALRSAARRR